MNKIEVSVKYKAVTSQEKLAIKIIKALQAAGYKQTYIVGGYVRDFFMKRPETGAIDLATEAKPQAVTKILGGKGYKVIPTGLKHGTVTVHRGNDDIEITTFRTEGKYSDSRHPDRVNYVKDVKLDSSRRDFTVNALYLDPIGKKVFDFHGGIDDIKNRTLRFVGKSEQRIAEDPLRLMRGVRFAAVLGLRPSPQDLAVIKKKSRLLKNISAERVKQELDRILLSSKRSEGLELLRKTGLLEVFAPELVKMHATHQSKNFHSEGNVWVHTLLALSLVEKSADLSVLYGLLFHDVGKAVTLGWKTKDGRKHSTFYGHQQRGADISKQIMKRLKFSNREIDDITWFVLHHHVPYELLKMRVSKQNAWLLEPRYTRLLKIYRADSLASIPTDKKGKKLKPSLHSYNYNIRALKKVGKKKELQKKLISGNDVIKIMKIAAGPMVGKYLAQVKDRQLAGKIKTRPEALEFLKSLREV